MSKNQNVTHGQDEETIDLPVECLAVILDLDGVITDTSMVHADAWKCAFDSALRSIVGESGRFQPFEIKSDYFKYVDGRTRIEGIKTFLSSRQIDLPLGEERDQSVTTINGIGNYKNGLYIDEIKKHGVKVFHDAVAALDLFKAQDLRLGLATSSKNADLILKYGGIEGYFDVVVDGNCISKFALRSKPAPDIFLHAAQELGVSISQCAVIEDSHEALIQIAANEPSISIGIERHDKVGRSDRFAGLPTVTNLRALRLPHGQGV